MTVEERPTDLIQSVSRACRILEEIGSCGGRTAKQIAMRCGYALPTTYHLLRTLTYEGYAVRRPGGTYVLGMKIAGRFRDLLSSIDRPATVHDVLLGLAEVTGHTVYFAQFIDGEVVLTDLVEGRMSPHLENLIVGFDEGAHATALGKALLSTIPAASRQAYLQGRGLRPFTANTVRDADRLNYELRLQAEKRLFTEEEQYRPDVCCAAVLVSGETPGAIGLSSRADRWSTLQTSLCRTLQMRAGDVA